MRPLLLQVEDSHYNEVLQAIKMLKYVHFSDLEGMFSQGNTQYMMASNEDKLEIPSYQMNGTNSVSKPIKQKNKKNNTLASLSPAEERAAKISALRGSISKEAGEEMLKQLSEMRNEWDRQF
jgi:hypothetical protein